MDFKNGQFIVKLSCLETIRFQESNRLHKFNGRVKERTYECEKHYYRIARLLPGLPYYIYIREEESEKNFFKPLLMDGEHAFAYSVKDCEKTIRLAEEAYHINKWLFGPNEKNQNN